MGGTLKKNRGLSQERGKGNGQLEITSVGVSPHRMMAHVFSPSQGSAGLGSSMHSAVLLHTPDRSGFMSHRTRTI
jgi:hypothetical protein